MKHRSLAAFFICVFWNAGLAHAGTPDPAVSEARMHFQEGSKAFNLGEFDRAVKEYKAAYNAKPDPVFLYNIAQSYRLANDLPQALFFYRSFLRNVPNTSNRKDIEDRIHQIETQLTQQKSTPAPATPTPAPVAPTPVTPAPIAPVVESPPVPAPTVPTETTETARPVAADLSARPAHKPVYKKAWFWGVLGGVVVAAGVGIGLGIGLTRGDVSAPSTPLGNQKVFLTVGSSR